MKHRFRSRPCLAFALVACAAASPALQAQTPPPAGRTAAASDDGYSWLPGTRRGYVGINLGRADYGNPCGTGGFGCDNPKLAGKIYSGGMFNDFLGMELGYLHMGRADRAGGRTDAQGLNLSLMGRVPFGQFNAFVKGGATYGRTHVSAAGASGVPTGTATGWGASYGAGVGYELSRNAGLVLEWERHDFRFRGVGKQEVEATTIGYVHRF